MMMVMIVIMLLTFEILTAVNIITTVFWVETPWDSSDTVILEKPTDSIFGVSTE
jgi:hypothetical protein